MADSEPPHIIIIMTQRRRAGLLRAPAPAVLLLRLLAAVGSIGGSSRVQGTEVVMGEPRGFRVDTIYHEVNTNQIVVRLNVTATARTVPIIYMSQEGWPESNPASNLLSSNPCEQGAYADDNVCCINALIDGYQVAPSIAALYEDPGVCPRSAASGLWEKNYTQNSQDNGVLSGAATSRDMQRWDFLSVGRDVAGDLQFPPGVESRVQAVSADTYAVELRIDHDYVKSRARSSVVGPAADSTFKYEFYVGVTFVTLLDYTSSVDITSAQVAFDYFKSDFVFMSIATEKEATPVKRIDVVFHQGKSLLDERLYQYLEFDVSYEADRAGASVEIDLGSLRFVRHASILDVTEEEWQRPCAAGGSYETDPREVLDALAEQTCLPRAPTFCAFDADDNFFMPFPSEFAQEDGGYVAERDAAKNLYVKFDLLATGADGFVHTSQVFIGIDLQEWPVLEHCEDQSFAYSDVTDALDVTVTAGIASLNLSAAVLAVSTDSPNREIREIAPGTAGAAEAGAYASAALAVEFDAREFMGRAFAGAFSYQVDSMVVLSFLGADGQDYQDIRHKISQGEGFTVARNAGEQHYSLTADFGGGVLCTEVEGSGGVPAGHLQCFWRTVVVANEVQPAAEDSVYFYRSAGAADRAAAKAWVADTIMGGGDDYGAQAPGEYFDNTCRHAADAASTARSYGCLFIDPGYRWLSAVQDADGDNEYSIGDKTIVVAVVTIVDGAGTTQRRRLLSTDASGDRKSVV